MEHKQENFFIDVLKFSVIALVVVIPIRIYIAQPFVVSGASMDPTFETGEYLIVDQLSYHFDAPARGDVVIFRYPLDESKYFIKRVVGLPGEVITLEGSAVIVRNNENPEGFILDEPYLISQNITNESQTTSLKGDEYYVLGDNRKASFDSRMWGPLKEKFIVGRAFLRLLPITKTGAFPGAL